MQPTLLVLAAGMGSRYGGLKQIDPVGPSGETIIDYSIYDALRAGFGRLVFVIRRDIEADFRASVGRKFENQLPTDYVFQELAALPSGFTVPPRRTKPWGTGHAVLVAAPAIDENFAVINADDFYGADSFGHLAAYLRQAKGADYGMVGFTLRNTLSDFGSVSRGLCTTAAADYLESVVELTKIEKVGTGATTIDAAGQLQPLSGDEIVSMNMWGFTPSIFDHLQQQFTDFLQRRGQEEKAEFFIPTVVNNLITSGQARVKVLSSAAAWFGITYQQDRPYVIEQVRALVAQGVYPERLWPAQPGD